MIIRAHIQIICGRYRYTNKKLNVFKHLTSSNPFCESFMFTGFYAIKKYLFLLFQYYQQKLVCGRSEMCVQTHEDWLRNV